MKLILYIGGLLIVLAAAMPILDVAPFLAPYAMIAGSLCFGYALWHEQRGKQACTASRPWAVWPFWPAASSCCSTAST